MSLFAGSQFVSAAETCGTNVEYMINADTISFSKGSSDEDAAWGYDCGRVIQDNTGLHTVIIKDPIRVEDGRHMFDRIGHVVKMDLEKLDVSHVTDMEYMFADCGALSILRVSGWDVSNVTNMRGMFTDCVSLTGLDLSGWDTSKVMNAEETFSGCDSLTTLVFGRNTAQGIIFETLPNYNETWYFVVQGAEASEPLPVKIAKEEASLFESYNPNRMAGIWSSDAGTVIPESLVIKDPGSADITGKKVTITNTSYQLTAETVPAGGLKNLTWFSSDPSIAGVGKGGMVEFRKAGTVTITALSEDLRSVSASATLYLRPEAESLTIKDKQGTDLTGKKVTLNENNCQLRADASPSKAVQTVAWSSGNTKIAKVNSDGKVTFEKAGTVMITAVSTDPGKAAANVELTLLPKAENVIIKDTKGTDITGKTVKIKKTVFQLNVSALPAEAKQTVTWKSGNTKIADVDSNGKVTFKKAGTVTITAVSADRGKKAAWVKLKLVLTADKITILSPKEKDITGKKIKIGENRYQLKASASPLQAEQSVTWKSGNTEIADVDAEGKVTFKKTGTVTITATSTDSGKASSKVKLILLPKAKNVIIKNKKGTDITGKTVRINTATCQLNASALPAEAAQTVAWKSGNTKIADVDANGKVTFKKAGTVTITAVSTDRGKKTVWVKLTLLPRAKNVIIKNTKGKDITGKTVTTKTATCQLNASALPAEAEQTVKWTSSNTKIADVDAKGNVTFKKAGTVTITAVSADRGKKTVWVKLTLLPRAKNVIITNTKGTDITGKTVTTKTATCQLNASALPAEAEQTVTWTSGNTKIADVDAKGKVTFKKAGTVTITAVSADRGKKTAWVKLQLLPSATKITILNTQGKDITGKTVKIKKNTYQLKANASPEKAEQTVKWTSSDISIAQISKKGLVKFKKSGTVTITATSTDRRKKSAVLQLSYKSGAAISTPVETAEPGPQDLSADDVAGNMVSVELPGEALAAVAAEDAVPAEAENKASAAPAAENDKPQAEPEKEIPVAPITADDEVPSEPADEDPFRVSDDNYLAEIINGPAAGKKADDKDKDAEKEPVKDTKAEKQLKNEELRNMADEESLSGPMQKAPDSQTEIINEARPETLHTLQLFRIEY